MQELIVIVTEYIEKTLGTNGLKVLSDLFPVFEENLTEERRCQLPEVRMNL